MPWFLLILLLPAIAMAAPQPVRDTAYDWRCVNPDGTASNHQRQDTAIYACQTRAEANPGQTYYIEGGRYRVRVEPTTTPPPTFQADLAYQSIAPSADSIHPSAPAGSLVEVDVLTGQDVRINPNGSANAAGPFSLAVRYNAGAGWTQPEVIEWLVP